MGRVKLILKNHWSNDSTVESPVLNVLKKQKSQSRWMSIGLGLYSQHVKPLNS